MKKRLLGIGERLWVRLGATSSINIVMSAQIEGDLDLDRLKIALDTLISCHPIMRARIVQEADGDYIHFEDNIVKKFTIESRQDGNQWKKITEDTVADAIGSYDERLWNMKILKGDETSDLILAFSHAVIDGRSILYLLKDLLSIYRDMENNKTPELNECKPFPCFESEIEKPSFFNSFISTLAFIYRLIKNTKKKVLKVPQLSAVKEVAAGNTGVVEMVLDKEVTAGVLAACKKNKVGVHGLMCTLMMKSLHQTLDHKDPAVMGVTSAVDARTLLKGDYSRHAGYFVSAVDTLRVVSPNMNIWSASRAIVMDVRSQVNHQAMLLNLKLRNLLMNKYPDNGDFIAAVRGASKASVFVTNFGRIDVDTYGSLKLTRLRGVPSVHFLQTPYITVAMTSFQGKLCMNFSYARPWVSEQQVQDFVSHNKAALITIAQLQSQTNKSVQPSRGSARLKA